MSDQKRLDLQRKQFLLKEIATLDPLDPVDQPKWEKLREELEQLETPEEHAAFDRLVDRTSLKIKASIDAYFQGIEGGDKTKH